MTVTPMTKTIVVGTGKARQTLHIAVVRRRKRAPLKKEK